MFVGIRVYTLQYFSWYATKALHEDMIKKVLNAPINLYFDVTPIGRILNKFSKDLSMIELQLGWQIGSVFVCFFFALTIIIMSAIVVYWILLILPILLFISAKIYTYSINSYRETTRIESLTKSPLLSFLSESCNGAPTIRAFGKQKAFIKENNKLLNNNILAITWQTGVSQWFALRLDLVSIVIMAFACAFCIVNRNTVSPVFLGMMLSNILIL
jgi:ABC-type multidrug transport system fused ATPase/permease subunit